MKKNYIKYLLVSFVIALLLVLFVRQIIEVRQFNLKVYNESVKLFEQGDYAAGFNKLQEMTDFENYAGVDELLEKYNMCPRCGSILGKE